MGCASRPKALTGSPGFWWLSFLACTHPEGRAGVWGVSTQWVRLVKPPASQPLLRSPAPACPGTCQAAGIPLAMRPRGSRRCFMV